MPSGLSNHRNINYTRTLLLWPCIINSGKPHPPGTWSDHNKSSCLFASTQVFHETHKHTNTHTSHLEVSFYRPWLMTRMMSSCLLSLQKRDNRKTFIYVFIGVFKGQCTWLNTALMWFKWLIWCFYFSCSLSTSAYDFYIFLGCFSTTPKNEFELVAFNAPFLLPQYHTLQLRLHSWFVPKPDDNCWRLRLINSFFFS